MKPQAKPLVCNAGNCRRLFAAVCTVLVCLGLEPARSADVTVDGSIRYQTIDGWGITHYVEWKWEGPDRYPTPMAIS